MNIYIYFSFRIRPRFMFNPSITRSDLLISGSVNRWYPSCYFADLDNRECFKNVHKRNYAGTKNLTVDGIPCVRWDNYLPYNDTKKFSLDGFIQNNYCRIPIDDTQSSTPWCYIRTTKTGSDNYWGSCNIPNCCK